jgi:cell division protein FtsB
VGAAIEQAIQKAQVTLQAIAESLYRWRRKCATVAVAVLAVWVAYHAVFGANGTMVYSNKRTEYRSLNKEIYGLKQENDSLAHQVESLKTDPRTIEKEAREQLRYARPGEVIYTMPQAAQVPSTATAQKR